MRTWIVWPALAAAMAAFPASAQLTFAERGGSFAGQVDYPVGNAPYTVVAADLNADGKADVVSGNYAGGSISVLLGRGDGTFAPATTLPAGNGSEVPVVADFNGDGKPDIAVANLLASTVSVFLGNGQGGFAAAVNYAVGVNPHAVAAADFNGDGKIDLASADGSQGSVSMLLGTGAGSFLPSVQTPAGCINPRDLVAADFNGNGQVDVALTCQGSNTVSVLLGNGAGGFGAPTATVVGTEPFAIAAGTFDAGTSVDLVVSVIGSDKLAILLGDGNGGFAATTPVSGLFRPRATRVLDLDDDGKQDLVTVTENGQATVFMGLGNGGFSAATAFAVTGGASGLALADFKADGEPDLAVAAWQANAVALLVNTSVPPLSIAPSATVEAGSSYAFRKPPIWINRQTSGLYPAGYPYSHTGYLDLDRDGDTDFVRTFSNNELLYPLQVMINDGDGNFSDQTASRIVGSQPGLRTSRKVLVGDYDGDGWPDVLVLGHGIDAPPFPGEYPQLFLSRGDGTLSYSPDLEAWVGYHHGGASADVDGNGTIDFFTNDEDPAFLLNDGQGHFTRNSARVPHAPGNLHFRPISSELVDVDGDGYIDLVADGYEPQGLSNAVYWGSSSGTYLYANRSVLAPVVDMGVTLDFAIEDIDHDGRRDIIVVRTGSTAIYEGRYIQVLRQTAERVFTDQTATRISFDASLHTFDYIRAQDFNGDGFVDLFIDDKNDVASGQYAWVNNGSGVFTPYTGAIVLPEEQRLSVADASVAEGNAGSKQLNFTISLLRPAAAPVSFDVYTAPGTASPGSDYTANAVVGASVAAGQTSVSFPVTIQGDTEVEGHESFTVNLANVAGAKRGDGQAVGRIINDDLATLGIADASIAEGNGGVQTLSFAVQLSRAMPNPVTFDIATSNGTATAGSDYTARSQVGRFLDAGRTRLLVEVEVKGDALVEPSETFSVTLSNVSGAALGDGVAVGTIVNDDAAAKAAKPGKAMRAGAVSRGRVRSESP
jgi:hypothetical protein